MFNYLIIGMDVITIVFVFNWVEGFKLSKSFENLSKFISASKECLNMDKITFILRDGPL